MATFVETEDLAVFIDPAVSLAPRRFSLPPHEVELRRLREVAEEITGRASEADVIVVTHYHYDHHDRGKHVPIDIYAGKVLIVKDPRRKINVSQRIRASKFLKLVRSIAKEVLIGDSSSYTFGRTQLTFSQPVPHGTTPKLGYVVEVLVKDSSGSVLHTSDIEGGTTKESVDFIINSSPDLVIMDGPPTYLLGYGISEEELNTSIQNLRVVAGSLQGTRLVIDHHLLRDLNYRNFYSTITEGIDGASVLTAAEFMGRQPLLLEARRKELYGKG